MPWFVSPQGDDRWSGTLADPNADQTDGPFASLERARHAIRQLQKKDGLKAGGCTVYLRGGDYVMEKGFVLQEEDSGRAEAPIVYRAREGERVRLLGGWLVPHLEPVRNPAILARLDEKAREHVLQADLRAFGLTDFGRLRSRGFGRQVVPAHLELFFGGRPMTLARWPNEGFTTIARIGRESRQGDGHGGQMGLLEAGFHYEGDRPRRWQRYNNVWMHGYWAWDWANSYEEIATIDMETRLIKTKPPYGLYGYKDGQRFYFLNILEELDQPGEYYVDVETGLLYFWPPGPVDQNEILVSVLEEPMVRMENVSHVTLEGLTFECTRGHAIVIEAGHGNRVAGCTIRNIGNHAVVINGGTNHGVQSCDITSTGDSGIEMSGGDRKTLTPCGHFAHNNHIWRFGRWSRCYVPAVHVRGVGMRVSHNLIHDAPHTAILYWGNENLIEFNEIHHVTLETGDCGAIYTGRDYTARGNIIRHNFIHHTGGYGMGSMAVYLDDCVSGQMVVGNLFLQTTRAVFIGGGRDIRVENNVFIDCVPAVHVDGRGLDRAPVWHNMIYQTMKERLDAMNHHRPPYSDRYPELQELDPYYAKDDGIPPGGIVIARNICLGGRWLEVVWHAQDHNLTLGENLVGVDPGFIDVESGDYRLTENAPAWQIGFEPISFDRIGLIEDEYRAKILPP